MAAAPSFTTRYSFEGASPEVHEDASVARESTLVGDVTVAADASIWPGARLRGDIGPVSVGEESHVGENATLHASTVGDRVMVGNGAVINDSTVEDGALVGFNAVVDESTVGEGSVVASGAVVTPGTTIPPESFVYGSPASVRPLSETTIDTDRLFERYHSGEYANLANRHEDLFE
ncbi:gamma carbonic anhydrase family protein [Natronomonas sp. EA1]|uniref:gamma carbonic anhydrase family protein n=1 Tax=Natronomonas sp. EA1 TaxID=3421655 RepID=UPI003EC11E29